MNATKVIALTTTCLALALMSSTPAMAKKGGGKGDGGGSDYAEPETLPTDPVYSVLEETVPYTGRTHLVMIYDSGVFPRRIYTSYGDRIMFVNQSGDSTTLVSSDDSWSTGELGDGDGYLLLVQEGVDTSYEGGDQDCGKNSCSFSVEGAIEIDSLPAEVDYGAGVLDIDALVSEYGISGSLLQSLLNAVALKQIAEGITDLVTG